MKGRCIGLSVTAIFYFNLINATVTEKEDYVKSKERNAIETKIKPDFIKTNISKCCENGKYVNNYKKCVRGTAIGNSDFSELPLYNMIPEKTGNYLTDIFNLEPGKFQDTEFKKEALDYSQLGYNFYLTENGILYVEKPNESIKRWFEVNRSDFCIDFILRNNQLSNFSFWTKMISDKRYSRDKTYLLAGLFISCLFLMLVLFVYSLLPELRNLTGLVQMAYVFSLFGTFLLLAIWKSKQRHNSTVCLGLTYSIYFFFLASFCWINVMSWIIWSAIRRYRLQHSRWFKFGRYCVYAWGLPLAMTIMLITLDNTNMKHIPWFVTPKILDRGCFLGGDAKLLYLYTPMMFLTVLNFALYLLICIHLCRHHNNTAVLDNAAGPTVHHRTLKKRFIVFVKLFSIMGLNWILEVISSFYPGTIFSHVSDVWNMLTGFLVFLVTIGTQKKVKDMLMKRLQKLKESWTQSPSSKVTSSNQIELTDLNVPVPTTE